MLKSIACGCTKPALLDIIEYEVSSSPVLFICVRIQLVL